MSGFWKAVDETVERMGRFECRCEAIHETHTHDDCSPVWRAVCVHGATVSPFATVTEAKAFTRREVEN